jgi:catechol 2,3-dioxygenase-like lactoylglutathione lyase family enzyme
VITEMNPYVSAITLGVRDLDRAKKFYEALGWPVEQDTPYWVSFKMGDGSCGFGLYPWDALAADAAVAPESSGFRGFALNYIVPDEDRVATLLADAERAGGAIAKPVEKAGWGVSGFFTDPDGYLWKVAAGAGGDQHYAE